MQKNQMSIKTALQKLKCVQNDDGLAYTDEPTV